MKDQELIKLVQLGDERALLELYDRYRWVICKMQKDYYVSGMEPADWEQEGLLICYQSALEFQEELGTWRGYFYTRVSNFAKSQVRKALSVKRQANQRCMSHERLLEKKMLKKSLSNTNEIMAIPSSEVFDDLCGKVNRMELAGLMFFSGKISLEETCLLFGHEKETILKTKSSLYRLMNKIIY
ncbi:MAG: hypothetical protein Q3960_03620 [Lactobacillus sp.]|nr:hypothetical protein [Lactobacillus sp.]